MTEIWKDIEGYEGKYQVSNLGRVRSLDQMLSYASRWGTIAYRPTKGKVLTQRTISGGYKGVLIKVQGKTAMKLVHRLVANAFVSPTHFLECTVRPSIISSTDDPQKEVITAYRSKAPERSVEQVDAIIDSLRGLMKPEEIPEVMTESWPLTEQEWPMRYARWVPAARAISCRY